MNYSEILSILSIAIFVQLILVIISIGTGRFLIDGALNTDTEPKHLIVGMSFFVGVAFLVVLTRAGSFLTKDAKLTVISVLLIAVILLSLQFKKIKQDIFSIFDKNISAPILFTATVIVILLLLFWLPPEFNERGAFSSIGSLHSYRYAWVSNFIYKYNNIPVISQNTAQSILAFMAAVPSFPVPFLYLFLWLISSIFFLSLFVYGLLYKISGDRRKSIIGLAIFMIGNTAFSANHIIIIDSGSPYLLNGYSDTLFGVFSIFFILFLNGSLINGGKSRLNLFVLLCLIVSFNFYCAPQNILLIPLLIFCIYIFNLKELNIKPGFLVFWLFVLSCSSLISVPQGGMLTPPSLIQDVSFPGVMSPLGAGVKKGLSIMPGVPFGYGWFGHTKSGMPDLEFAKVYVKTGQGEIEFLNQILWKLEEFFVTSLRIHVFPILGILFLIFKCDKIPERFGLNASMLKLRKIGLCGGFLFAAGFILCFSFVLNGYKWELTRFLIPGISIGMFGFSLAVINFETERKSSRFLQHFIIAIFVFGGPAVNLVGTSSVNAYHLMSNGLVAPVLFEIIGSGPVVK